MVRDAYSPPKLAFLVKLIEPELNPEELAAEAQYLLADLQDLSGLGQTRFHGVDKAQGEGPFQTSVQAGVQFEAAPDRLRAILKRLCHRLDDRPLETLVVIQQGPMRLQVQTHESDVLAGLVEAAEAMLDPQSVYRAKAEAYCRTHGELSPSEDANLELLRLRLGLSEQEAESLKAEALGPYKTLAEKRQYFREVLMEELARENPLSEATWELLEELADNLNLPPDDATAIYQERLHQIQVDAEAIRRQQEAEAEPAFFGHLGHEFDRAGVSIKILPLTWSVSSV
ncbi:MAG: hypothetical protein HC929_14935 [Leptolyngbyaceae cyanobacterium SM2_5_2]|nr:hypothetical protein [Leptolyngbyaceae cyanobacterium SM2_5_2]